MKHVKVFGTVVVMVFAILAGLILDGGTARADSPVVKLLPIPQTVNRPVGLEWPLIICAEDGTGKFVPGIEISTTLTTDSGVTKVQKTMDDGCLYLFLDSQLNKTPGITDLGLLELRSNPTVNAELIVSRTLVLENNPYLFISPPDGERGFWPRGLHRQSESVVRDVLAQSGFKRIVNVQYVPYGDANVPPGGLISACRNNPWAPLGACGDMIELSTVTVAGWNLNVNDQIYLAFKQGGQPVAQKVTTVPVEVVIVPVTATQKVLPNNLLGATREVAGRALAASNLQVNRVDAQPYSAMASEADQKNWKKFSDGGGERVISASYMNAGKRVMLDLSKNSQALPSEVTKIDLGVTPKTAAPAVSTQPVKPVNLNPVITKLVTGTVAVPSGMYNHSQADVRKALEAKGLKVGNVAFQKANQVGDDAKSQSYFNQTSKGGLLSASYMRGGERVYLDLFNPDAPQNQVVPGTVIDLGVRMP